MKLIPYPSELKLTNGNISLNKNIPISIDKTCQNEINLFILELEELLQIKCNILNSEKSKIIFSIENNFYDTNNLGAYKIDINTDKIIIKAKTQKGIFYATRTLLQIFMEYTKSNQETIEIPTVEINDKPNLSWRGIMLDSSRYMQSVKFIKKFINQLAFHKLNKFHWHLTDDQGWRIEIKKYPRLAKIGGFRKETVKGHIGTNKIKFDGKKYGGYYTQEQIIDIVDYASKRYVDIIPEIDIPGHSQAAVASYPKLGCSKEKLEVCTIWGINDYLLNVDDTQLNL